MNRDHSVKGFTLLTGADDTEGQFFGVLVIAEAVIADITWQSGYEGDDAILGVTLPAGIYLPMRFIAITLTSGTVRCEKE